MTIQTLRRCRSEEGSNSIWQIVSTMGLKVKKWLNNSQFELREARAFRQMPSRSLQDRVGDHVQRQTRPTLESHHRMNSYYASIDKVLTELELRVNRNSLCFVTVKHPIKKACPALLKVTNPPLLPAKNGP